jgi:FkbM family methyltransferase
MRRRLNNAIAEIRDHFVMFGLLGVFLLVKARLLHRPIQVRCKVSTLPHSVHLRLRTSDVAVFREVMLDSLYEWECSMSPKVIVDAGANIGLTSILYANKYPQARILSIEPEPSNFEILRKNTARYSNITAVRAALWKEACDLQIFDPEQGYRWGFWGFRTQHPEDAQGRCNLGLVRGVTVDALMKTNGIDYIDILKVDIEGAEKEVFEKASSWIGCVGAMAVELHDRFRAGCSDSVNAATRDFEVTFQRGETRFLQRRANVDPRFAPRKSDHKSVRFAIGSLSARVAIESIE